MGLASMPRVLYRYVITNPKNQKGGLHTKYRSYGNINHGNRHMQTTECDYY